MNIDTTTKITTTPSGSTTSANKSSKEENTKFAEELANLKNEEKTATEKEKCSEKNLKKEEKIENKKKDANKEEEEEPIENVINGLQNIVDEINKTKNGSKLIQTDDINNNNIKDESNYSDNNKKDNALINNDINILDQDKFAMPQMNSQMNFNSNGQPFSEFVNQNSETQLNVSQKDLAEEAAILSTMNENIAIANKHLALKKDNSETQTSQPDTKTIVNEEGVKKVDTKTNITVDTVVKYDSVIMDKNDVDFFTQLIEKGSIDMNTESIGKSAQVSKTLADLIAKSMNDNKPVRIDFDNNISVIIKIGKDGKISADFLPSSQIAEAYLKENLPLLKQRFDDNNIDYNELNQRKQQRQDDKDNRKKGRNNE